LGKPFASVLIGTYDHEHSTPFPMKGKLPAVACEVQSETNREAPCQQFARLRCWLRPGGENQLLVLPEE
jgi:hypothetical protein